MLNSPVRTRLGFEELPLADHEAELPLHVKVSAWIALALAGWIGVYLATLIF